MDLVSLFSPSLVPALPPSLHKFLPEMRLFSNPFEKRVEASFSLQTFHGCSDFFTPVSETSLNHLLKFASNFNFLNPESLIP